MEAVADIFDVNNDGFIDYKEFVAALKPEKEVIKVIMLHYYFFASYPYTVKLFCINKYGKGVTPNNVASLTSKLCEVHSLVTCIISKLTY